MTVTAADTFRIKDFKTRSKLKESVILNTTKNKQQFLWAVRKGVWGGGGVNGIWLSGLAQSYRLDSS